MLSVLASNVWRAVTETVVFLAAVVCDEVDEE
jgi:hypothetical protein